MAERLQKFLAKAGVASRRKCEELIVAGEVEVDGKVVRELGTVVDPVLQKVKVRGKPVTTEATVCVLLHKPVAYVTTVSDPEGRRTVMDLLQGVEARIYPVGRLDYDTSGLLLLSNDGELTYRLLHPKHHVEKVYRVTVIGMPSADEIRQLETGVRLEDGMTNPCEATVLRHHPKESVIELTIREGRNRQVRRMFEAMGYPVKRLKRIQFGSLELGKMRSGEWRLLTERELTVLYQSVGLSPPVVLQPGRQSGSDQQRRAGTTKSRGSIADKVAQTEPTRKSRPVRPRRKRG